MADQVTVGNETGQANDYTVSTDDAGASGQVQRVKLALSADGSAAHATVDADGVLVNLGANNDVTVTGNVAVTNAGLTELAAAIDTEVQVDVVGALPAGNNNIGDVDVASSALPTGAATSANQTTVIGHLDGVEGLLTTIDADTGTLAGAVAGTEVQVDVVAALPAGNNNIGDVDVASVPAPLSTTGGGTEAAALRVTVASDSTGVLSVDDNGSSLTVDGTVTANAGSGTMTTKETRSATGTTTQVADTASSTQLLASNANRLGFSIQNDSSAVLYIKTGTTASATDYTARLVQYAYYEDAVGYTGRVDGIWASDPGDGAARITEYS